VIGFIVLLIMAEWFWVDSFTRHDLLEGLLIAVLVGGGVFVGTRLLPHARRRRPAT
jgi:hypothetical protein